MKRTVFAVLVVAVALSAAADRFYIEDFTVVPGETQTVSIMLENEVAYTAFQCDLYIPQGLTVEQEDGDYIFDLTTRKSRDHNIAAQLQMDGAIRLMSYSPHINAYSGNSGALVTFNITPNESFAGPATIRMSNILFTTTAGTEVSFNDEVCTVQCPCANMRGDVNGDGNVNISDVTALIDLLLGSDSSTYHAENADCNADGNVTISDVTTLIDALLAGVTLPSMDIIGYNVNGVLFKMVKVEGGTFMMGATAGQGDQAYDDELPVHEVSLSSYSIGETEVTQALWQAVMDSNPSGLTGNLNRPVETVSWNDCQTFIAKLNQMTGKSFRLPTEAEWEFAARGGNLSHDYMYAGSNNLDEVAWVISNIPSQQPNTDGYGTQPVAQKAPNELGLYDMSGNVYEWCNDWFDAYRAEPQVNPTGPGDDEGCHYRVNRGGSWNRYGRSSRVSLRNNATPESAYFNIGLRLAM